MCPALRVSRRRNRSRGKAFVAEAYVAANTSVRVEFVSLRPAFIVGDLVRRVSPEAAPLASTAEDQHSRGGRPSHCPAQRIGEQACASSVRMQWPLATACLLFELVTLAQAAASRDILASQMYQLPSVFSSQVFSQALVIQHQSFIRLRRHASFEAPTQNLYL
jgi:hypothetical protein